MKILLNGQNLKNTTEVEPPHHYLEPSSEANPNNQSASAEAPVYANDSETGAPVCLLPDNTTPPRSGQYYRLYFSNDIKAVCQGDASCLIDECSEDIHPPRTNISSKPYFWRIDTILASGEVLEGRIWST